MAYFYELNLLKGDLAQCVAGLPMPLLCEIQCIIDFDAAKSVGQIKSDPFLFFEAVDAKTNPITLAHLTSCRWEKIHKKQKTCSTKPQII